jgi:hypothetical protein
MTSAVPSVTRAQDRVQRDAERVARRQRDRHPVARAHAAAGQAARGRVDLGEQLRVGQRVDREAIGVARCGPREPGVDLHGGKVACGACQ